MRVFRYRFAGFMVLGLLLLLGVTSDPSVMNTDESDDDTMVVAVEPDLSAPYQTLDSAGKLQSEPYAASTAPGKPKALFQNMGEHAAETVSVPLIVPLRT